MAAFSEQLLATAGARFAGPISILRNWTFCLFYVMAELWGSVVVSLLFWGFANQVRCRKINVVTFVMRHVLFPMSCRPVGPRFLRQLADPVLLDADHYCRRGQDLLPAVWPWSQRGAHLLGACRQVLLKCESVSQAYPFIQSHLIYPCMRAEGLMASAHLQNAADMFHQHATLLLLACLLRSSNL